MNHQNSIGRRTRTLLIAALVAGSLSMTAQAVEVGDSAPDFTLPGSDGQSYQLSEMRGQHVVIAFFPKAFTGG
jgi:peroxiredoxin Q/BCP